VREFEQELGVVQAGGPRSDKKLARRARNPHPLRHCPRSGVRVHLCFLF
jgi:hypothetical protein